MRTSNEGKPQTGISFLLIDMKSPGITVRPIITMDGEHEVNEVWFDNVEVPADNLIGEENKGWTYAKHLLAHERTNIADVNRAKRELERLEAHRARPRASTTTSASATRSRSSRSTSVALEMMVLRVLSAEKSGKQSLDVAGLLKIRGSEIQQRYSELMMLGRRPATRAAHPRGDGSRLAGRPGRRQPCVAPLAVDLLQHAQDDDLRRQQRSAAQHRRADRARLKLTQNMDFDFTDDQESLRDAVRRVGSTRLRRSSAAAPSQGRRRACACTWDELAELGLGRAHPVPTGRPAHGLVDAMVVLEELGRGLVSRNLHRRARSCAGSAPISRHQRRATLRCSAASPKAS